jgi:hypothetical protein
MGGAAGIDPAIIGFRGDHEISSNTMKTRIKSGLIVVAHDDVQLSLSILNCQQINPQ